MVDTRTLFENVEIELELYLVIRKKEESKESSCPRALIGNVMQKHIADCQKVSFVKEEERI